MIIIFIMINIIMIKSSHLPGNYDDNNDDDDHNDNCLVRTVITMIITNTFLLTIMIKTPAW